MKPKKSKQPWPTAKAMAQVYEKKLWGDNKTLFYSGTGSHDPAIVVPYLEAVTDFLSAFKTPLSVCDLGCGDFNIGRHLVAHTSHYTAIDIVPSLIAHNKLTFTAPHLKFQCLDIAVDILPKANCVIIRQVLQHLSNDEIEQILPKLHQYNYLILTEHLPNGDFTPNLDIISGQGTRLKKKSGVDVTAAPFLLKYKRKKELVRVDSVNGNGVIVTVLFEL